MWTGLVINVSLSQAPNEMVDRVVVVFRRKLPDENISLSDTQLFKEPVVEANQRNI